MRLAKLGEMGWDITFNYQPPNSPDTNTLDLAFFRAIQSIQHQKVSKNIDELIDNVHQAYADMPLDVCKRVWTTAQVVMNSILLADGGNNYALPHVAKSKLTNSLGQDIPLRLPCRALLAREDITCDAIKDFVVAERAARDGMGEFN